VSCTPPPLKSIVPLPLRQLSQGQPRRKAPMPREPLAPTEPTAPIRDSNGNISGAVMVFHDVTARRRAEAESERLYKAAQIEIANRKSADAALRDADRRKDEFLATLAHELRNPLAPIRQAALISKAPGATEAQKRWSHDVIDRQVQHMSLAAALSRRWPSSTSGCRG
jgi:signal transduction histidine kinase